MTWINAISNPCITIRNTHVRPGRNAPCPCGSGKKFKVCCAKGALDTVRWHAVRISTRSWVPVTPRMAAALVTERRVVRLASMRELQGQTNSGGNIS